MSIGGQLKTIVIDNSPKYGALYEIESPEVLISEAWAKAVEQGRWPAQVRPHTRQRQPTLYARVPCAGTGRPAREPRLDRARRLPAPDEPDAAGVEAAGDQRDPVPAAGLGRGDHLAEL